MHTLVIVMNDTEKKLEDILAPYNVNGTEYYKKVDVTEDMKDLYEHYSIMSKSFKDFLLDDDFICREDCNENILEHNSFCLNEKGEVDKVEEIRNPNAHWDWWIPGGRWSKLFLLKDGSRRYSAKINEIDFKKMELVSCDSAREHFNKLTKNRAVDTWETYDSLFKKLGDHGKAALAYRDQPDVIEFKKNLIDLDLTYIDIDTLRLGKNNYIKIHKYDYYRPGAFIYKGEWHEVNRQYMFRSYNDTAYINKFKKALASLPNTTQITAVDTHF